MTYDSSTPKKGSGVASALGAVMVGAAVGAAAAYLSDKNKRDRLMNKAKGTADTLKTKTSEVVTNVADKTGDALEKAGKSVKSKNKVETTFDDVADTTLDSTTF